MCLMNLRYEADEFRICDARVARHLPPSLSAHAATLTSFDVGVNSLSGTLRQSYGSLPKLEVLYLQNNSIGANLRMHSPYARDEFPSSS